MIIIKDNCYKGTRILLGNEKRTIINKAVEYLISQKFTEISIPIIQLQKIFKNKVGEENNNMMYNLTDRGNRELCLLPEVTAVIQKLALDRFKYEKDLCIFYISQCFRGENPQKGRYREFTQLGVEIINPVKLNLDYLYTLSKELMLLFNEDWDFSFEAKRGLDYYKEGKGFEAKNKEGLQLLGGGEYQGGIGFAIGIDRLNFLIN